MDGHDQQTLRKTVLSALKDSGRPMSPADVAGQLQIAQSAVRYHLSHLARDRLVKVVESRETEGAIVPFYECM